MDWRKRIVTHPDAPAGKPAVQGTRLSVELILGWLVQGGTVDELLSAYPPLTTADALAALGFAADVVRHHHHDAPADVTRSTTATAHALAQSSDVHEAAATQRAWRGRIVATPDTLFGRPRIAGTRIGVDFILDLLAAGWPATAIHGEYRHLAPGDVQAAVAFALDRVQQVGSAFMDEDAHRG